MHSQHTPSGRPTSGTRSTSGTEQILRRHGRSRRPVRLREVALRPGRGRAGRLPPLRSMQTGACAVPRLRRRGARPGRRRPARRGSEASSASAKTSPAARPQSRARSSPGSRSRTRRRSCTPRQPRPPRWPVRQYTILDYAEAGRRWLGVSLSVLVLVGVLGILGLQSASSSTQPDVHAIACSPWATSGVAGITYNKNRTLLRDLILKTDPADLTQDPSRTSRADIAPHRPELAAAAEDVPGKASVVLAAAANLKKYAPVRDGVHRVDEGGQGRRGPAAERDEPRPDHVHRSRLRQPHHDRAGPRGQRPACRRLDRVVELDDRDRSARHRPSRRRHPGLLHLPRHRPQHPQDGRGGGADRARRPDRRRE